MEYKIKVHEIDDATDYPLLVLSGMTGLSQNTINQLVAQGCFPKHTVNGEEVINGKQFTTWARTVNNTIEVEKTDYTLMEVNES